MNFFDIAPIVQSLRSVRHTWRSSQNRPLEASGREFPSRVAVANIMQELQGALFPMRLGPVDLRHDNEDYYVGYTLGSALHALLAQARLELSYRLRHEAAQAEQIEARAYQAVQGFAATLPGIRSLLDTDVLAAYRGDPAARTVDEVLLSYPGVQAMIYHRIAHQLYRHDLPLLARVASELAHGETGIDIHPGAQIGGSFFIDHGTGVVIGETTVIGERVRIYQAVTLGAKRFPVDESGSLQKGLPRHPIVQDDVVIYAGATILGRVTLGQGCVIGGNVWLTTDVPAGSYVTQADCSPKAEGNDGNGVMASL